MSHDLSENARLPPLWPVTWVIEAFGSVLSARTIRAKLRSEGAFEVESKPHLVDPDILRAMWPSVYHRVVELQLEKRAERQRENV